MKGAILAVALSIAFVGNAIGQSAYESSRSTTDRFATRLSRDSSSSQDYRITRTVGFGTLGLEYALSRKQILGGPLVDDSRRIWAWTPSGFSVNRYYPDKAGSAKFEWEVAPYARVPIIWEAGAKPGEPIWENGIDKRMPKFTYNHPTHRDAETVFGRPFMIQDAYFPFLVAILSAKQLYTIANYDLKLPVSRDGVLTPSIEETKRNLFARLDELLQEHEDKFESLHINYKGIHRHECYGLNFPFFERSQFLAIRDHLIKEKRIPNGEWSVRAKDNKIVEIRKLPDNKFEETGKKLTKEQADLVFAAMRDFRSRKLAECGGFEMPGFIFQLNWPKLTECQIPTPVSLERGETKVRCGSENLGGITFDLDAKEMLAGGRKWFSQDTIEGIKMELAEVVAETDSKSVSAQQESSKEKSRRSNAVVAPR